MGGMNAAHGDDTAGLKKTILSYLLSDTSKGLAPVISPTNKSEHGWNHLVTAELLCPLAWEACEE